VHRLIETLTRSMLEVSITQGRGGAAVRSRSTAARVTLPVNHPGHPPVLIMLGYKA